MISQAVSGSVVTVDSDVMAGAKGEMHFGTRRLLRPSVYVSVGTGISYSLIDSGQPYRGRHDKALLLGEVPVPWRGTVERLEGVAAGPAILAAYRSRLDRHRHGATIGVPEILRLASTSVPVASEVVREAANACGWGLAILANLLDPAEIVLGGGLGSREGPYFEACRVAALAHIWKDDSPLPEIRRATKVHRAGLYGAAAEVFRTVGVPSWGLAARRAIVSRRGDGADRLPDAAAGGDGCA